MALHRVSLQLNKESLQTQASITSHLGDVSMTYRLSASNERKEIHCFLKKKLHKGNHNSNKRTRLTQHMSKHTPVMRQAVSTPATRLHPLFSIHQSKRNGKTCIIFSRAHSLRFPELSRTYMRTACEASMQINDGSLLIT